MRTIRLVIAGIGLCFLLILAGVRWPGSTGLTPPLLADSSEVV